LTEIPLEGVDINVKRFSLPVILKSTCPICSEELENDLNDNYLSYPTTGINEHIHFYCDECDHEHTRDLILKMSLEYEEEGELLD